MSAGPYDLNLGSVNAQLALNQAEWIRDHLPFTQRANGSAKFYRNYISWGFWRDSQLPLIQDFVAVLEKGRDQFESIYQRPMQIGYIYLSYVEDASQEMCLWHRDGYWWSGQFHLTILGNAEILVREKGVETRIRKDNGTVWYLNGTQYEHKIAADHIGPRFELLAPCGFREPSAQAHRNAATETPERWIDGRHPEFVREIESARIYMENSIRSGRASNLQRADWAELPALTSK